MSKYKTGEGENMRSKKKKMKNLVKSIFPPKLFFRSNIPLPAYPSGQLIIPKLLFLQLARPL